MAEKLLTREQFKIDVFKRDKNRCVVCSDEAVDAHHIIDRKLFDDGGYYLSNGASVCEPCHWLCETTELSVEFVRDRCGITNPVIPVGIVGQVDKWGNHIVSGGMNPGPMFYEEGVQKALKKGKKLHLFWNTR